ncbi:hypothetical protein [Kitasatospora sp. NBC_01266]|uniref:hypothetical protein n=1 Tax=Kitasatospora sp. NBC_01266 TaxID=2903572 RepID=UPI002E31DA0B|nr:hypothetical protein [Kitasatospora sp. NBC_01266]
MTDLPDPRPVADGLSLLLPDVVPVAGADPELVAIGERYWALAGFADEFGTPVWCEKTREIDLNGWGWQLHAVAAAGVRAVVPARRCPSCAGPLSLTSRTAFQQLLAGRDPACVACTGSLLTAVRQVVDPARKARRDAAKVTPQARQPQPQAPAQQPQQAQHAQHAQHAQQPQQAQHAQQAEQPQQQAVDEARARWRQSQQEVVEARYPAGQRTKGGVPPDASVRQLVAALALLRYAPSGSPVGEVEAWPEPLHPAPGKLGPLLDELLRAGLVKIHPTTPATAFGWLPDTFEDAVRKAGGDLDKLATPRLSRSRHPTLARYYAPYGAGPGAAVEQLDAALTAALDPAGMTADRQDELLALARELIADEALRYFSHRLQQFLLPAVAENHAARLAEAARKVTEYRSLGEIYNLVWRATQAAAEADRKSPHAPRAHLTAHAVNQFETHAQRAATEPGWEIRPFSEVVGHGPAAMTRTLCYALLDRNPTDASLPRIRAVLPAGGRAATGQRAAPGWNAPGAGVEPSVVINWLNTHPDAWRPADLRAMLGVLKDLREDDPELEFEGRIVAGGAKHLYRMYERLEPAIGARSAALAVLAATALLVHPVTLPDASTNGEWLRKELYDFLLSVPREAG